MEGKHGPRVEVWDVRSSSSWGLAVSRVRSSITIVAILAVGMVGCSETSDLEAAATEQMCRTVSDVRDNVNLLLAAPADRVALVARNAIGVLKDAELDSIVAATDTGEQVEGLRRDTVLWFQGINAGGSRAEGLAPLVESSSTLWRDLGCDASSRARDSPLL